jgi:hypothetical protein
MVAIQYVPWFQHCVVAGWHSTPTNPACPIAKHDQLLGTRLLTTTTPLTATSINKKAMIKIFSSRGTSFAIARPCWLHASAVQPVGESSGLSECCLSCLVPVLVCDTWHRLAARQHCLPCHTQEPAAASGLPPTDGAVMYMQDTSGLCPQHQLRNAAVVQSVWLELRWGCAVKHTAQYADLVQGLQLEAATKYMTDVGILQSCDVEDFHGRQHVDVWRRA